MTWLWAVVVAGLWWRLEPLVERLIAVLERQHPPSPAAPTRSVPVEIPPDLYAIAEQESEPWAQQQILQSYRDRFAELGTWDAVRGVPK